MNIYILKTIPLVVFHTKLLFAFSTFFITLSAAAIEITQVDSLSKQWLNIESQSTQLQKDWQAQAPILKQQISLLTAEKKQLQQMLTVDNSSQEKVENKRSMLIKEQDVLEQQQYSLSQQVALLNKQLILIDDILPPPLKAAWKNEHDALGVDPELSLQLQVSLAKLNKLNMFAERISVHEMPLVSPQGNEILVKQVYLGLGIAWFTSANGQYTGWGQATNESWVWHFDTTIDAEKIAETIAMFEKKTQADFVTLPMYLANKTLALPISSPAN